MDRQVIWLLLVAAVAIGIDIWDNRRRDRVRREGR